MGSFSLSGVLLAFGLFGQTSHVPYDQVNGGGPTFTIATIDHPYKGSYSSIRAIDFRNFSFPGPFTLRNGSYKHEEPHGIDEVSLRSVHFLGGSAALVIVSWFGASGSSIQGGEAYVFVVSHNRLRVIQDIGWDTHFGTARGPTDSFDPRTNTLTIQSAHYIPGDAHCCVSAMDVVTFRWNGARFIERDLATRLTETGKTNGKKLPQ